MSRVAWFIAWFAAMRVELREAWQDGLTDEVASILYDIVYELGDTLYTVVVDEDKVEVRTSLGVVVADRDKGTVLYYGFDIDSYDIDVYIEVGVEVVYAVERAFWAVVSSAVRDADDVEAYEVEVVS